MHEALKQYVASLKRKKLLSLRGEETWKMMWQMEDDGVEVGAMHVDGIKLA